MANGTLDLLGRLPSEPQPRSQLTIFYSGSVNVFDDVPADKAHAIMLLLHSDRSVQCSGDDRQATPLGRLSDPPPCDVPSSVMSSRHSTGSLRELIHHPLSRSSTPPPPSPYAVAQADKKQQIICKRSQAELPFARKASLARFLEKRKDRVQVKAEAELEDVPANGSSEKRMKLPTDKETAQ